MCTSTCLMLRDQIPISTPAKQIPPASTTNSAKYRNTVPKILLSAPTAPIAPAPIAMLCGQTILPIAALRPFDSAVEEGSKPRDAADHQIKRMWMFRSR